MTDMIDHAIQNYFDAREIDPADVDWKATAETLYERVCHLENTADRVLEELVAEGLVSLGDPQDASPLARYARELRNAVDWIPGA